MIDVRKILNRNNLILTLIIFVIFSIDRFTKIKIINYILSKNNSIYINDYLNLDLVWNTGIGFGLLSFNSSIIYNSITALIGLVIIFLIYLLVKSVFF